MNWISNDDDFGNAGRIDSLINATSNNKKFHFCACNIYSIMKSLGKGFIVDMNMRYGGSDVVFDTNIHNDESMREVAQGFNSQTIKLMNLGFEIVFIAFTK